MFTKIMKGVMLVGCFYLAVMSVGCGGGGGGDETASPASTNPPTTTAPPTTTVPKNYATIDELAADMKTPEALGAWMKQNISYLYPFNMDMANWKYLNPNEVFSGRQGDCIHQSAFEKEVLIKNGYACKLLFVLRFYKPTHAVCYWPDAAGKLWYLENAWESHRGIQGPFDSERAMAAKILEWLIAQDPGEPQIARYGNFDSLAYGIGWNEFIQPFVNGPTVP
jgi:hypothetical protein